jgi:hypothetical protein
MPVDSATVQTLKDIAHRMRIHSINATSASNSGYFWFIINSKVLINIEFIQLN